LEQRQHCGLFVRPNGPVAAEADRLVIVSHAGTAAAKLPQADRRTPSAQDSALDFTALAARQSVARLFVDIAASCLAGWAMDPEIGICRL